MYPPAKAAACALTTRRLTWCNARVRVRSIWEEVWEPEGWRIGATSWVLGALMCEQPRTRTGLDASRFAVNFQLILFQR